MQTRGAVKHPFLVFASAGDSSCNVPRWVGPRDWGFVVYYDLAAQSARLRPSCMRMPAASSQTSWRHGSSDHAGSFEAILGGRPRRPERHADQRALPRQRPVAATAANDERRERAFELRAERGTLRFTFIGVTAPLIRTDVLRAFLREYLPRRHGFYRRLRHR